MKQILVIVTISITILVLMVTRSMYTERINFFTICDSKGISKEQCKELWRNY